AYANLHTDQERDYFMQRYHDVISSFGGKTSYDADNRPLLVMRSNLWASGYDVDGTDQTSLGQFSGRVQQTYKHSVPRFFVSEHVTMFTLALVRFPPTATKEIQYLNAKCALTYTDIAGDLFCMATCRRVKFLRRMFSVLVIRLRSLRLLRVSGIVMR